MTLLDRRHIRRYIGSSFDNVIVPPIVIIPDPPVLRGAIGQQVSAIAKAHNASGQEIAGLVHAIVSANPAKVRIDSAEGGVITATILDDTVVTNITGTIGGVAIPTIQATGLNTPLIQTPIDILGSNLLAWYKRGTGIFDSLVGGSLVTTNLQEIGRWEDQSSNAYHLVRFTSTGFGHIQWMTGDTYLGIGTVQINSDYFDVPNAVGIALSGAGQGEIFNAWRSNGAPSGSWTFSNSGAENLYPFNDNHTYEGWGSNTRRDLGILSPSVSTDYRVYDIGAASNDYGVWLNNTSVFSTNVNTVTFNNSAIRYGNGGTTNLEANISEVVISKIKLSTAQRNAMYTYLSTT